MCNINNSSIQYYPNISTAGPSVLQLSPGTTRWCWLTG